MTIWRYAPQQATTPVARATRLRSSQAGFTLLEISLVILIIAIVLAIVIPRLRDPSQAELTAHVHRLAITFRLVRNEAILTGHVFRLNYDLDHRTYWITDEGTPAAAAASGTGTDTGAVTGTSTGTGGGTGTGTDFDTSPLMRPVKLPDTVAFSDIVLQSTGKLVQGRVYTRFFPDGFVDPTVVHMDNGRQAYTLSVWPLTGQVSIYRGYRDLEIVG